MADDAKTKTIEYLREELQRTRRQLAEAKAKPRRGPKLRGGATRNFPFKRGAQEEAAWRLQAIAEGFARARDLPKWIRQALDEATLTRNRPYTGESPPPLEARATDYALRLTDEERARYEAEAALGGYQSLASFVRAVLARRSGWTGVIARP